MNDIYMEDVNATLAELPDDFDYEASLAELEEIAAKVEDPSTAIDDIDKYILRSKELLRLCKAYLRGAEMKVEKLDEEM